MRLWLSFVFIALGAACEIETRGAPRPNPDQEVNLANPEADSLRVTLSAPERVRAGTAVPVTITLENLTTRRLDLNLTGREVAFDVIVTRDNSTAWRRLAGVVVPAILQLKTLGEGEKLELRATWQTDANLQAGEYEIEGSVLTAAEPLRTNTRTIEVIR